MAWLADFRKTGWQSAAVASSVLLLIAAVYLPVRNAQFVWDDIIIYHDTAWLRQGDQWLKFLVNGLSGYVNYFRPLLIAMATLQLRAFDAQPGPMHLVSLALHLCNTVLVGALARRWCLPGGASLLVIAACMLVYGLHPALVESVVWLSCQNELAVTFFVLLGLLANTTIVSRWHRAFAVATCFFLAACSKESAVALPMLLVLCDSFQRARSESARWMNVVRRTWSEQRATYLAITAAGVAYLALRTWALGFVVAPSGSASLFAIGHWQKVCYTFANYLRLAIWPMTGTAPLHEIDEEYFETFSRTLLLQDAIAVIVVVSGVLLFLRRRPLGALIVSFAVALIPVLNIIPIRFVESVYHERYMTTALAVAATWLASTLAEASFLRRNLYRWIAGVVFSVWTIGAIANVRLTIPLWSTEQALWQWAERLDPHSVIVRDHLLSVYILRDDVPRAHALAQELVHETGVSCPSCLVNAAFLALHIGDEELAANALDRLKDERALGYNKPLFHQYVLASGELLELRKDFSGAEDAYRVAMAIDPYDPTSPMQLAALLIFEGRFEEGQEIGRLAIELSAPDERERRQAVLDAVTKAAKSSPHPPNSP